MAKTALYQKYRSATFEEVVGQEYIVRSIKNAVRNNKIGHAYLFCGPRGTGKTTMARLLAKAVNCDHPEKAPCGECENCIAANNGTHPDIIEINAANETHVEDIRDLIDRSRLAPMQGKYKIYIIDEVHQLSSAASSALLKTLKSRRKMLFLSWQRRIRRNFCRQSFPAARDMTLQRSERIRYAIICWELPKKRRFCWNPRLLS